MALRAPFVIKLPKLMFITLLHVTVVSGITSSSELHKRMKFAYFMKQRNICLQFYSVFYLRLSWKLHKT